MREVIGGIYALILTLALTTPALGGQRVDLYDLQGRRTGYAIVDRESGRVDFYDANSRRLGWGRVTPSGKVERFGPDGRREGESGVPILLP